MTDIRISDEIKRHWQQLRGRTYDLLTELQDSDLNKKLPFHESQDVKYQFWCMLGTQESFTPWIATGEMKGWACSLHQSETQAITLHLIQQKMQAADQVLFSHLNEVDLLQPFSNGQTPLSIYLTLVEHESHHQGQLINFIYADHLPIPQSWADQWALSRS